MDEESLSNILDDMEKKVGQFDELLEDHDEADSKTLDPQPCLSLVEGLRAAIGRARNEANNMWEMIRYVEDRVIKDTIDHLADKMRSNSTQSQLATSMINLYFEGPGSDQRREYIEVRLKDNYDELCSACDGSFQDALKIYEKEVEEMALKYVNEDMQSIVDEITGA
ncbi:hypothetical protein KCU65_g3500, partial [Aureobasidium melanogenum]